MKISRLLTGFVALVVVSTTAFATEPEPQWSPLFQGIDVAGREVSKPLQKAVALRIDLEAEGIEFKTTPPNKDFKPEERETWRQTTSEFLVENNLAAAVNGNFYAPFNRDSILYPGDANVTGLAVSNGFVESPPLPRFPSFLVKKDGDVEIRQVDPSENLDEIAQAVSGPAQVLKGGEILPQSDKAVHPRTAVGYSKDKKYVYFVVIDGRRPGFSVGATLEDVGETLRYFGAYDGLNLDGGGSTTMVVRGENGKPEVLNRPINAIVPGPVQLRRNGNAIGVKANALDGTPFPPFDQFPAAPDWKPYFRGIDFAEIVVPEPRQKACAFRIDLQAEGIEFKTTPPNKDFKPEERETWRQTTPEFLTQNELAVAVNANFYSPFNHDTILNPGDSNLLGLAVSDGFVESQSEPNWPSFLVKKDGSVEIRQVDPNEDLSDIRQAVSGSAIILKDGEVVESTDDASIHPRTVVGCSQDKRYVYFIVIDGRRPEHSVGATLKEAGELAKYFGACDGLNLDGGGSTTMVARGPDGNAVVLNRPINNIVPGVVQLRRNGNAIGAKALAP